MGTMKMTYRSLLEWGEQELKAAQLTEGKWDAWLLFSYLFGMERGQYYLVMNQEIIKECLIDQYQEMLDRRKMRIPLQHITGEQEFMGYSFRVNEHVLIPRQDTECLVEKVWEEIVRRKENSQRIEGQNKNIHVLDMCTGSGCIAVSLCKMYKDKYHQELNMTAVDISEHALQVAQDNGSELQCEHIQWVQSDLFGQLRRNQEMNFIAQQNDNDLKNNELKNNQLKYDVIVSNPPYIPTEVIASLEDEVKLYDPWAALDGKEDGLYFYNKIIKESVRFLRSGGTLAFEIGCEQGASVESMMKGAGYSHIEVSKDLAGLDRVVLGYWHCEGLQDGINDKE